MILILITLKVFRKEENIKVSYNFIYKALTKEGILSPKARKKQKEISPNKNYLKKRKLI